MLRAMGGIEPTDERMVVMDIARFTKESLMREPVKAYLIERGFFPAVEFWLHGCGPSDIVAGSYAKREGRKIPKLWEVVAVELKLSDFATVLMQAKRNKHLCDWSYIAFPVERIEKMRDATKQAIRDAGVGLLSVGDEVVEVITPQKGGGLPGGRNQVKTLWRRVRHLADTMDSNMNMRDGNND